MLPSAVGPPAGNTPPHTRTHTTELQGVRAGLLGCSPADDSSSSLGAREERTHTTLSAVYPCHPRC
jgi:hypothetical protein